MEHPGCRVRGQGSAQTQEMRGSADTRWKIGTTFHEITGFPTLNICTFMRALQAGWPFRWYNAVNPL
jgi:hypothetical protein